MKTIIGWQVTCHKNTLKINQSAFIRDILEEKNLTECNLVNIPIKTDRVIDISEARDFKEADLKVY